MIRTGGRWVRLPAVLAVGLGSVVLLGWLSGTDELTRVTADGPRMVPFTALGLLLLGATLVAPRIVALALSVVVGLWAMATIGEWVLGAGAGFDALISGTTYTADHPGRPSPHTVAVFACLALVSLGNHGVVSPRSRLAALALAGTVTVSALIGHGLGVQGFYGIDSVSAVSGLTAVGLSALLVGLVAARTDRPPAVWVAGPDAGPRMTRGVLLLLAAMLATTVGLVRGLDVVGVQDRAAMSIALLLVATVGGGLAARAAGQLVSARRARDLAGTMLGAVVDGLDGHAIVLVDRDGLVLEWGAGAERLTGIASAAALGAPLDAVLGSESGHPWGDLGARLAAREGEAARWVTRPDGRRWWLVATATDTADERWCPVILRDGTRDRDAASELRRSQTRFDVLLAGMKGSVTELGHDLRVTHVAGDAWRAVGIEPQDMIGRRLRDLPIVSPTQILAVEALMSAALGGERGDMTYVSEHTGRVYWLLAMPVLDANGLVRSAVLASQDVTDRVRAEERFSALLEAAPDGILIVDTDGVVQLANLAAEVLTGYPRHELTGRPVDQLVPAAARERHDGARAGFTDEPRRRPMGDGRELALQRRDGGLIPVDISLSPLHGPDGDLTIAAIRDATARRSAERAVRAVSARFTQAFDHAPIGKALLDEQGRVLRTNPALHELLGRTSSELEGLKLASLLAPTAAPPLPGPGEHMRDTVTVSDGQGGRRTVELSVGSFEAGSEGTGHVVQLIDLTERERAIAEARAATARAEASGRVKDEFVSRMSHELRTPLTAVVGFGELLARTTSGEQQTQAETVVGAAVHLTALVDDILDLALVQADQVTVSPEPVELAPAVDAVCELLRPRFPQGSLRADVPEALVVSADVLRLRQILVNLVENARKYGRVPVSITAAVETTDAVIRVRDHGPGVSEVDRERIFEPFERGGARRDDAEGTGLGLALSRGLAEAMSGALAAVPADGPGACFELRLPLARLALADGEPPAALETREETAGLVLHVDDNPLNTRLVQAALAFRPGVELVTTGGVIEAFAAAERRVPDLVLCDLHLPDGTGFDLVARLRGRRALAKIPIVIVSADVSSTSRREAAGRGVDGYLGKPFRIDDLLQLVDGLLVGDRES